MQVTIDRQAETDGGCCWMVDIVQDGESVYCEAFRSRAHAGAFRAGALARRGAPCPYAFKRRDQADPARGFRNAWARGHDAALSARGAEGGSSGS